MSDRFDAICVGCGPAGNLAAYLLAMRGFRVLLLDKEALPRVKVCGGGLTSKALSLLPYDVSSIVHQRMEGAYVFLGRRTTMRLRSEGIGAMVERSEFDAFMTARAAEAGASVLTSTPIYGIRQDGQEIAVQTSRGDFRARMLIGADGANSSVRTLLFPDCRPEYAFGIEANFHWPAEASIPALARNNALFDFGATRNGYGWIFPKRDHFNVGIYRIQKSRADVSLKRALQDFKRSCSILQGCKPTASVGHPISISDGTQPVEKGRAILIGDAAGLGESFFGEGIAFALKSAVIAANWAADALEDGGFYSARSFRSALGPLIVELRYSFVIAKALYRLPSSWLDRIVASPASHDSVIALLRGQLSYQRGLWRLLRLMPPALLRPTGLTGEHSPFRT
jgi:geranylgeranyl reductase family protein